MNDAALPAVPATDSALATDVALEDGVMFATSDEALQAAYRLRYQIYVEEMGRMAEKADHEHGLLTDDMDATARSIIAVRDGKCLATMRIHYGGDAPFADFLRKVYGVDGFETIVAERQMCVVERLMVVPDVRGDQRFTAQIYLFLYQFLMSEGVEVVMLACEPHLIGTWRKLGFRPFTQPFTDPRVGILMPLCGIVWDIQHLRKVGSPLLLALDGSAAERPSAMQQAFAKLPLAVRYVAMRFVVGRFMGPGEHGDTVRRLGEFVESSSKALLSADAVGERVFAEKVKDLLEHTGAGNYALFEDMDDDEILRCIRSGHILDCSPGDMIVRKESVTRTLFLMLDGDAEVQKEGKTLITLGAGALIGEVAYILGVPRTADIIAGTDARVLTFSARSLRDVQKKDTELYAKLLRNICRCICRRMVN